MRSVMKKFFLRFILICSTALIFSSCSASQQNIPIQTADQNIQLYDYKYDSHFPLKPVDKDLERILETIKLISSLAFYESYEFDFSSRISIENIRQDNYKEKAAREILFERPASGTATVIFQEGRKVALITCDHIVSSPDTIITYFEDDLGIRTSIIKNAAFKTKESNNIIFLPGQEEVSVVARDTQNDLALIFVKLDEIPKFNLPVFDFKIGNAEELTWGAFVYIIGYPYGKKLVSSALVSSPNRDRKHSFIIDATMHRGISGGIILALRDGPPNFELVGLANAISGERELVLRPDPSIDERDFQFSEPYKGQIYIDKQIKINYGITFAVSIETIREFLTNNKKKITSEGLFLNNFFE
jgi:hypothetical protein